VSSALLEKVATVLEAAADEYDAKEAEYARKDSEAKSGLVTPILDKVALATGMDEDEIREKLSAADLSVVEILSKLASEESASELGGPDLIKNAGFTNKEDGASMADSRFLNWLSK
jgi:hypothetical protein